MDLSFWNKKKVFLTGHTGFKGGWLSMWLKSLGAKLTGYALNAPTEPSLFNECSISESMHSIYGNIQNLESLHAAMEMVSPEIVFHMAAQSLVRHSYNDPVGTYATNVMGTVHVLETVRHVKSVRAVVIVTSDKCYENREWCWGYREKDQMGGSDPYSNSKGCAELVTSAYRSSFFSSKSDCLVGSVRAGNVIGGGDWAIDRLIPDAIRAFASGNSLLIRNPNAIRPWQHVLEPLRGYMLLAEGLYEGNDVLADGWNFGPVEKDARPVSWIIDRLAEFWNDGAKWEKDPNEQPHEAFWLALDNSKARSYLNWKPVLDLEHALEWVVEWYKVWQAGGNLQSITMEQIKKYQNTITGVDNG